MMQLSRQITKNPMGAVVALTVGAKAAVTVAAFASSLAMSGAVVDKFDKKGSSERKKLETINQNLQNALDDLDKDRSKAIMNNILQGNKDHSVNTFA